jgi:hypothetical protein
MTLRDPTCNSFYPGTVAKWLCLNCSRYNWSIAKCFEEAQKRGISNQDIYQGLKEVLVEQDAVDKALWELMMDGSVPFPESFYISSFYDYLNTCATFHKDFTAEGVMRWWTSTYLVEPQYQIKASESVQEDFMRRFQFYFDNPPKKPLLDRISDHFERYNLIDFMKG